jgi:hypothetical protein
MCSNEKHKRKKASDAKLEEQPHAIRMAGWVALAWWSGAGRCSTGNYSSDNSQQAATV